MGYRDGNWDVPDPGSHGGPDGSRMTLTCAECRWSTSSTSAVVAVGRAQQHADDTGHSINYRHVAQQWSKGDVARA